MTSRLASTYDDPVEFMGASSPTLERAVIVSSAAQGNRVTYDALLYWVTSATFKDGLFGPEFVSEDLLTVVREGDRWRVDGWEQGSVSSSGISESEKPVGDTRRVTMRFLDVGDTPKCEGGRPIPESFVSIERLVPSEVVVEDLALSVVRELATGPWPHEGDAAGMFGGVRVERVDVRADEVRVSLQDLPEPIDCDFGLAALTQTLHSIPELKDHVVVIERAEPQEPPVNDV